MPHFSNISIRRIEELEDDLQMILHESIKYYDFSVYCAYRNEVDQNKAFEQGFSKLKYPLSKHNKKPSTAVDVKPYPTPGKQNKKYYILAGVLIAIAGQLFEAGKINRRLRWGGDWDMDQDIDDNTFNDLGHFELL